MPALPVYNAQRNIQPQTAGPLQTGAEQPYIDQQKVIKTVADIGQKWSDAQDVMQTTDVKAKHGIALAQIQAEQAADPDFNNAPKYKAKVESLNGELLKGISNGSVRNAMSRQLDYDNQIASIKMQSDATTKQLAYNKVQVKNNLDLMQQQKLQAKTEAERTKIDGEINTLLALQVKSGVLSYAEADKELKDAQVTGVKYEIYSDQATKENDSKVLKELQDQNNPKYSYLDPKSRLSLIEEAQRRIFQNNQTFKREVEVSQNVRNTDMIEKIATQTATFKDIDAEFKIPEEQGGIKRSILLNYQKYMQVGVEKTLNEMMREKNADTKELTKRARQSKEYNDLIEMYLDDKTDQWKAKEALSKALADGVIDSKEQQILYPLKDNLNDIQFNRNTGPVASAVKEVKKWMNSSNASDTEIAMRVKQLLGGVAEGGNPQAEMKKIMDAEMLKHYPDYQTYPVKGKAYIDQTTHRAFNVFPDGNWAWVDGATKK